MSSIWDFSFDRFLIDVLGMTADHIEGEHHVQQFSRS